MADMHENEQTQTKNNPNTNCKPPFSFAWVLSGDADDIASLSK
jgi:hypothetical protein